MRSELSNRVLFVLLVLTLVSGALGATSAKLRGPCGGPGDCVNPNCTGDDLCGILGGPPQCQNYEGCCNILTYWATWCFGCPGFNATGYQIEKFNEAPSGAPCGERCHTDVWYICANGW